MNKEVREEGAGEKLTEVEGQTGVSSNWIEKKVREEEEEKSGSERRGCSRERKR